MNSEKLSCEPLQGRGLQEVPVAEPNTWSWICLGGSSANTGTPHPSAGRRDGRDTDPVIPLSPVRGSVMFLGVSDCMQHRQPPMCLPGPSGCYGPP